MDWTFEQDEDTRLVKESLLWQWVNENASD